MSFSESIYDSMRAVYAADTGAGGLANSSSSAYVRHWIRENEPGDRTLSWPRVEVSVQEAGFLSAAKDHARAIVRLHIYTKRDAGYGALGAIDRRIWTKFHRVQLTDSDNYWTFAPMARLRSTPAPATDTTLHEVVEFEVVGTRV